MVSCENINLDRVINLELKSLAFSQFKKFEINLKKINKVAKTYKKYLNLDNIKFQQNNKCKSVWWMIAFVIKSKAKSKKLMNYLKKHKIDTRNLFKPINEMKFYKFEHDSS